MASGVTSKNDGHVHSYMADGFGNGGTDFVNGHAHKIMNFQVFEGSGHIHKLKNLRPEDRPNK